MQKSIDNLDSFKGKNVGSICSGVGGLERVLIHELGCNLSFVVENEKWASGILKYWYRKTPNLGDLESTSFVKYKDNVDIIIGGTPCTSWSEQGHGKGMDGKSGLVVEFIRSLEEAMPKYFIWENVDNIKSKKHRSDYEYIKEEFEEVGYTIKEFNLNGSNYGTPQARERIFILGKRKDLGKIRQSGVVYDFQKHKKVESLEIVAWSQSTRTRVLDSGEKVKWVDHRIREDGLCNTLVTGRGFAGQSTKNYVLENKELRDLSVEEGELLMTWPEGWTEFAVINEEIRVVPKTARELCIGNGVVSNCLWAIIPYIQW